MTLSAKRLAFCVLIVLRALNISAQQTVPLFYEKVYLHTDRDTYMQGEDIWFKAYLVNAQNNKPINNSHNLYAELISPGLKIVQRHAIRLENGLGNGDFKLPDTISAGTYRIRAYTNWMRNFGDSFVFEKNITIINLSGKKATVANLNRSIKKIKQKELLGLKSDTLVSRPVIRFFPEGGSMVNNVSSVIAVKAEDEQGRGIAVSGQIFASSNRLVAKFSCDSLGMGKFTLQPDETQQYRAEATIKGKPYTFKLKDARIKGFTLGASNVDPFIIAEINCNVYSLSESGGSNLVIMGAHAGKTLFKQQIRLQERSIVVQIPNANFPEGVSLITLYDERALPLGERLVYVHHNNSTRLNVSTDNRSYQPKEKVTVKIKLCDSTRTNLSLAAVDIGMVPVQPENIVSYLELRSELKGNIEHPERYFDTTNTERYKQLDLLLLTQGWRDFVWKDIAETKFKQQYDVEQALTLTGRVRKVWSDKPLANMNITMFAPKATGDKLFYTQSDSSGKFRIDGPILYGYNYINFNSRRSDGLEPDGKSKGKTGGWIKIDSLFQDKMEVKPDNAFTADTIPISPDPLIAREKIKQQFTFEGINSLKTVQIKGYSNALPTDVIPVTMAEQKEYGSVGQYVVNRIPYAHWEMNDGEQPMIFTGWKPPYKHKVSVRGLYSDNSRITMPGERYPGDDEFWGQPMDRVLKVTIRGYQTVDGKVYSVELLMRPGSMKVKDIFDNTMADVVGYTQARVFYAPKYPSTDIKPDYRTTIHWEPNITTDDKGEATITYYNAEPKSQIKLIVQGVTDKGIPVAAVAQYDVK
ncbi:hypothetical protein KXQ82_07610 [Mucilaginibacter sp. HMF5004]|uniref:MG2 domain-containing protein n=1 Tax=Mucilaginibacter rivuli TaxID=2857527 RepID=UPI001C5ECFD2|nr:MG2 domain-containing protein [Mucilaginibacter rivuli]MBW4889576.1 hypothetical protein [Mucilaginibacter rivuli]